MENILFAKIKNIPAGVALAFIHAAEQAIVENLHAAREHQRRLPVTVARVHAAAELCQASRHLCLLGLRL